MPAEDSGLEFEDDVDQTPSTRPASTGRARSAGASKPSVQGRSKGQGRAQGGGRRGPLGRRGKNAPPRREKPTVTVRVVGLDRTFQAEAGRDLRGACRDNHVNVFWGPWAQAFNCRGVATCGLCKVDVVEGLDHLTPRTKKEEKRLRGKPETWRLACHAKLSGDVRIDPLPRIPVDHQVGEEAVRRALLTDQEREKLREDAEAARQAEREQSKAEAATPKEKPGLIARFQKKGDARKAPAGGKKEPSSRGLLGKKGKDKDKDKDKDAKKDAKTDAKTDAKKPAKKADDGDAEAAKAPGSEPDDVKPAKKSFGLKGRKS